MIKTGIHETPRLARLLLCRCMWEFPVALCLAGIPLCRHWAVHNFGLVSARQHAPLCSRWRRGGVGSVGAVVAVCARCTFRTCCVCEHSWIRGMRASDALVANIRNHQRRAIESGGDSLGGGGEVDRGGGRLVLMAYTRYATRHYNAVVGVCGVLT